MSPACCIPHRPVVGLESLLLPPSEVTPRFGNPLGLPWGLKTVRDLPGPTSMPYGGTVLYTAT